MTSKKDTSKIDFYFSILELFKSGKTTSEIAKSLKISKQKLYYHTKVLRDLGFLQKKSYLVWEVIRSKKIDLEHTLNWKAKKIRGHAFIWKVKLDRNYNWKDLLDKKNIPYKLVRGYTPRIFINNKKVWLAKESLVIYETKSFYGKNAIESRKYAVFELLSTLNDFSIKLNIRLGKIYFKPTREHYGMIKNELARQCNKNNEKIIVRDDLDGEWLWVDDSVGMLGELETGGKGFTKDRAALNIDVQKWYNDHKKHNFKVTPSFLLESIHQVTENQQMFNQNFESHVKSIKQLGNSADSQAKQIELLADVILELKEEIKK